MSAPREVLLASEAVSYLPDALRGAEYSARALPADIIGAQIVNFGAAPRGCDLEGGGLIIDYVAKGQSKRVVLAFSELGMWIAAAS